MGQVGQVGQMGRVREFRIGYELQACASGGAKVVYGRIGHTDFKNFDNIKDSPVYKDGILMNKP